MIGYPYTYGDKLTPEESLARLKEVGRGAKFALSIYTAYLLTRSAVHASDTCPDPTKGNKQVSPASPNRVNDTQRGMLAAAASSVCGLAASSGDFLIGFGCFGLVLIAMTIANRS